VEIEGWGRFIYPRRSLYTQMSIDLRSGTGAFGVMADLISPPLHTYHAQRTQIQILPPLSGCAHPSPHFHKQSLALQALRGGAPMKADADAYLLRAAPACPVCQRMHTWDGSLSALFLRDDGIWCRRCEQIVVDIRSVMASREIDCPAVGNESCDCAVCIT